MNEKIISASNLSEQIAAAMTIRLALAGFDVWMRTEKHAGRTRKFSVTAQRSREDQHGKSTTNK